MTDSAQSSEWKKAARFVMTLVLIALAVIVVVVIALSSLGILQGIDHL